MFGIADHVRNMDKDSRSYREGREAMLSARSITDCPTYGTTWDQGNWLAGWLDALAETSLTALNAST